MDILRVVSRMETLKSRRTLYVYYTTLYPSERTIHANFLGTFFAKSGEIIVRDSRARKRVEYRV